MILFALYDNFKFPLMMLLGVLLTDPVGALLALKLTHTPFSVFSALGCWLCWAFRWKLR